MQSLRRTAATAARQGRTSLPRQPRRYAHDAHGHGHAEPVNEPVGSGLWIPLAMIPAGMALYWVSRSDDPNAPPLLTRMINKYTEIQDRTAKVNDKHVQLVERAGSDRVLFVNTKPFEHVDMRFPEIMNQGSPYNVPAGHTANMDKVIAKFRKEAAEDNERKLEASRTNTVVGEQPFKRFTPPERE